MFDVYGNFIPDYPGQLDPRYNRPVQTAPPPAWAPPPAPQPAQTPVQTPPPNMSTSPQPVRGEIIPVPSIEDTEKYHVTAGHNMMFMTHDEKIFIVKEASPNGAGYTLSIYDKRPPAPPVPAFDPREYLTRREAAELIDERLNAFQPTVQWSSAPPVSPPPSRRSVKEDKE